MAKATRAAARSSGGIGHVLNKADIARVEAGVETLRQETRTAIEAVKSELLKWMTGLLIAQGGLIVALVKLL